MKYIQHAQHAFTKKVWGMLFRKFEKTAIVTLNLKATLAKNVAKAKQKSIYTFADIRSWLAITGYLMHMQFEYR